MHMSGSGKPHSPQFCLYFSHAGCWDTAQITSIYPIHSQIPHIVLREAVGGCQRLFTSESICSLKSLPAAQGHSWQFLLGDQLPFV